MTNNTRGPADIGARSGSSAQPQLQQPIGLGPLGDFVGYALRRAQLAVFDAVTQVLSPLELKPGEFSVLIVIDRNPGLRATDVCNALGIQKANFAPLMRRFEQRGLVKRTSSADDRRTQSLQLTVAGRRLLERALVAHAEYERQLLERLGAPSAARLIGQLNKLAQL